MTISTAILLSSACIATFLMLDGDQAFESARIVARPHAPPQSSKIHLSRAGAEALREALLLQKASLRAKSAKDETVGI